MAIPLLSAYSSYMKTVSLTSKNQLTIPVSLLREQTVQPGAKFAARWEGENLVLTPIREIRDTVGRINAALASQIQPRTVSELEDNVQSWPREAGERYGLPD